MIENKIELSDIEIKQELLTMLALLDEFLSSHNINYTIMSGTLLGAVRHDGFIPWDDDIDIGVIRPEYDKLVETIKLESTFGYDNYTFEGYEVGNLPIPFLKFCNKNIGIKTDNFNIGNHLWIDIFPIDGLPNKFDKPFKLFTMKFLRYILYYKYELVFGFVHKSKSVISKRIILFIKKIIRNISLDKILDIYIKFCKHFDIKNCDFIQDLTWGTKPIPKYLFDNLVDYQFENITVKGFKDYDTYLTCIYGDYMKLPPEDQRVNHGIKAWRVNSDEE